MTVHFINEPNEKASERVNSLKNVELFSFVSDVIEYMTGYTSCMNKIQCMVALCAERTAQIITIPNV